MATGAGSGFGLEWLARHLTPPWNDVLVFLAPTIAIGWAWAQPLILGAVGTTGKAAIDRYNLWSARRKLEKYVREAKKRCPTLPRAERQKLQTKIDMVGRALERMRYMDVAPHVDPALDGDIGEIDVDVVESESSSQPSAAQLPLVQPTDPEGVPPADGSN